MDDLSPRERRHERTRDAILSAAIELITQQGADKLSLREIARRIDYSPAGLYEYFGSKDEIIAAVCEEGSVRFSHALMAVSDRLPADEYLVELGLAYVKFARQNPDYFTFLFINRDFGWKEMPDESQEYPADDSFGILMRAVRKGQEAGVISRQRGVMDVAYALWGLAHGMATLQVTYLRGVRFDYASADRHALEAFVAGLSR